ncbi:ABATE domain-containing protein [Streptomyces sp. RS10V-4]|uniref:CGNR zinc finger domain-containing protein n=1 Tax=Streptomyces rhizoryzae TaxID=2932493 RepID=UPI002003DDD7|nr:ABATE domain-containing protein [Streptomyces rhizoryzae]MCK7623926.1 ABATE domain-containing protein [Streptomyces rhizoryzae]
MAAPYGLRFDCGRICLDLIATAGAGPAGSERLTGPGPLAAWLAGAGLVPPGAPPGGLDAGWVARFRALRALLTRIVGAELHGRAAPFDLALLNTAAAAAPPPALRAVRAPDGTLTAALAAPPDCAGLLAAVARDAVALLTDPVARGRLRRCAGDGCPLVYLDTSHGRRRRWCSGEVCGNRARVARHRRRSAGAR